MRGLRGGEARLPPVTVLDRAALAARLDEDRQADPSEASGGGLFTGP